MRFQNKRRLTPFIDKIWFSNSKFIYNSLLAVKYSEDVVSALKMVDSRNSCTTIRKRCRVLLAKMENPGTGSQTIANLTGTSRNFVDKVIHTYNDYGLQDVLFTEEKGSRPNRLAGKWLDISDALVKGVPGNAREAADIIRRLSGHTFSLTWVRTLMRDAEMSFKKLQPVPGKADPDRQKQWIADIQPVIAEAGEGKRRLLFMDAEQVKAFLEKVRDQSGDIPVSVVLDNARYTNTARLLRKRLLSLESFSIEVVQMYDFMTMI